MSFTPPTFDQPQPSSLPPAKKRRIWPWIIIPVGCLSVLLVCCGGFAMLGIGVMSALKSSDPYRIGLERAKANEEVKEALGEPVNPSFVVQGKINLNNDDGEADISFPVSGPKGAGQIHVQGTKNNGVWHYNEISITLEKEGKTIDLSDDPLANQH